MTDQWHFETRAVHNFDVNEEPSGGVSPSIQLSTTFARSPEGEPLGGHTYIRESNPNEAQLERALASLDGGATALAFGSGMAAITAFFAALPPESHVLLPDDSYYAVRVLANEFLTRWSVRSVLVDMTNLAAVRAAATDGCVIWTETPSNPLMKITDLAGIASIAREKNATFVVDGTFATPALQRPIEHGADVVMHSTTKYMGGHSDVHGGALIFAREGELAERVRHTRHITGGVGSPFAHWLVARGLRSLPARMRMHCENAARVAEFLAADERVERVFYPGLPGHAGHDVAARQMSAFGGMLSFTMRGGRDAALAVVAKSRIFVRATSLGGVESLIEHRASSEGPTSTAPQNLLRCSVGLEHPDDLIADLRNAMS